MYFYSVHCYIFTPLNHIDLNKRQKFPFYGLLCQYNLHINIILKRYEYNIRKHAPS